ncbi:transposase [Frankia sp. BMG5.23]|uniref:transposase n=1 Tax=Frankia sp. BMG5.23 TaxID=683305 RepID=UPI0034CDBB90
MTRFPTAGHLASWAGLCPGNNDSTGEHYSGRTRHGDTWLHGALGKPPLPCPSRRPQPVGALSTDRYPPRGSKRALRAVSHAVLVTAWHPLHDQTTFRDLGPTSTSAARTTNITPASSSIRSNSSATRSPERLTLSYFRLSTK